eukprot:529015-Rhodomonas_salina.1
MSLAHMMLCLLGLMRRVCGRRNVVDGRARGARHRVSAAGQAVGFVPALCRGLLCGRGASSGAGDTDGTPAEFIRGLDDPLVSSGLRVLAVG